MEDWVDLGYPAMQRAEVELAIYRLQVRRRRPTTTSPSHPLIWFHCELFNSLLNIVRALREVYMTARKYVKCSKFLIFVGPVDLWQVDQWRPQVGPWVDLSPDPINTRRPWGEGWVEMMTEGRESQAGVGCGDGFKFSNIFFMWIFWTFSGIL